MSNPDPVTGDDIRGLRKDTQGLAHSIDEFATKEDLKHERDNRRYGLAIGALLLLFVALGGWYLKSSQDQANTDRKDRSYGSCVQFNINQHNIREAEVQGLVTTFSKFIQPGQEARLELFAAELRTNVEVLLPYRDCSPPGIDAFLKNPPTDPNAGG